MEERDDIITLIDEEGIEQNFELLMTLEVEENEYAILIPVEADEDEDAYIFKIIPEANGEYTLVTIEDDEEYNSVVETYEAIMDEEENAE